MRDAQTENLLEEDPSLTEEIHKEVSLWKEYPTMHYFGILLNTRSVIAWRIFTDYFSGIPVKDIIVGTVIYSVKFIRQLK